VAIDKKALEAIFDEAIQFESSAKRDAYVLRACGDDQKLLISVRALLKHHDASSFLDAPIFEPDITLDESPLSEGPGTVIGRYKLLEKIGEGGMAVVYMAEQAEPIRRKVALKIIKLGMDTKSVIARFEAERQALAMMDHPNIAKVLDAGATETGRPYFVMELVTGVSITEYCDKNNLSTKERLALFIQVCSAVQHAHQKGIIHRDIKPTNVMVTRHEGLPIPKVIDFGIAKAINQKLTEKTLFTRYAHIIGTPAYMSPEQADLSDLDVDTRSDIYSLGVLLYELLTGTTPFSEEELRKAGYIEMQRVIREQEPPKPSTKLSTLGETLTDIAKYRGSTPDMLTKAIRGDLDWIVMKSLEKDRSRRYETANSLALDIRHHLENEPVMARSPGTTYRLQKFLRRHRSQTIAALAMFIIAFAAVVILSMWNQDRLQLAEAEGFRHRGILSQAREQYAKAEREAALEAIKPILNSKDVGPEAQLLKAGILIDNRRSDEAVTILSNLVNERPVIAGAAHSLLARILWESESPNAEKLKEIEEHRQKAEALLPETADAYFLRAMTAFTVKEQLASLDRALQLDPAHYESRRLRAFTYYASRKYDKMKEDSLGMTILRPRDPMGYSLRAIALRELGKYTEAITEYDRAISLTPRGDPQYVDLSTQRCETLLRMGDYNRVISDAEACLKLSPDKPASVAGILPAIRGRDALDTKNFSPLQYQIFCALTAVGDYEKADALFRQIISPGHEARKQFQEWCMKYVFDTLETGRSWHPQDREPAGASVSRASRPRSEGGTPSAQRGQDGRDTAGRSWHPADAEPAGAAFLPMVEAEETYLELLAKARRLTTDGFTARYSPDGKKLAFSAGVHGYSGVAVFDPATKETELLIVPGKDPRWSPDGKYIAFVRDCKFLRVSEFIAAERKEQHRLLADEEVWVMKADGTEPRRLARGGWPSWSRDSTCIYYQSRVDNKLCSISITGGNVEPRQIMTCSNAYASVSSDNQRVAYLEGASLKVKDLSSQTVVAEQPAPFATWGGAAWSPTGAELCLGGQNNSDDRTGLWIYSLDRSEAARTLGGQITVGSWSSDGTKLIFSLGPPYFEIWAADLDPNVSAIEALGPGQTIDEHFREMLAFYNRRIEADSNDAYAYSSRAHCYDCLHEREKATADMRQWSTILGGSDLQCGTARKTKRILNGPFNCQFVFSAERPVNKIPLLNVALGQKGRCNMKTFQIPMLSMSLLGLCLLSGLGAQPVYADFTFGERVNLKSVVPVIDTADGNIECFSYDGLEVYTSILLENRPGETDADWDLCVQKRVSADAPWSPPENLGSAVNSPKEDTAASISADGLVLYFSSNRAGGYGNGDIYITTRATKDSPWSEAVNIGATINSSSGDAFPWISTDGLELYFGSWRPGGYGDIDIYVVKRATADDPWEEPVNLGPTVNSEYGEYQLVVSPDRRLLFFTDNWLASTRPGGYSSQDIWMTKRASLSAPWETPVNLGSRLNEATWNFSPRISADGRTFYYNTARTLDPSTWDAWQVPIIPICDFNVDGIVDAGDVCIMIEHWLTDEPLCDIGPMPWGDGIVDVQDLIVLAEHLFEEFPPAEPVE
jgi:serine/threonine protein kinase/Tol biopolymer transport system component